MITVGVRFRFRVILVIFVVDELIMEEVLIREPESYQSINISSRFGTCLSSADNRFNTACSSTNVFSKYKNISRNIHVSFEDFRAEMSRSPNLWNVRLFCLAGFFFILLGSVLYNPRNLGCKNDTTFRNAEKSNQKHGFKSQKTGTLYVHLFPKWTVNNFARVLYGRKRKYREDLVSTSVRYTRGGIQNIPDWCKHLYNSCGSAKQRSQQAKL
jgi:hypothetical protein